MIEKLPSFLPPLLDLDGPWEDVLNRLYNVFKRDFIDNQVSCRDLQIIYDKRKIDDKKEEGFWHLITKNDRKLGRIPDYERAKRLPWVKPVIQNYSSPDLKVWDYPEKKNRVRMYLWLEHFDYAVILEKNRGKRKHLLTLITAFYVEGWKKKDLMRRYQKRIINGV
jgi:hypothetical protein